MKKLFTLVCAAIFSVGMMAEEVTLVDINFKDASWTGQTFAQGNTSTPDVINGVYFYSKNTDKQFSLADNTTKGLTFPANNMKSNNYFFAIPLTDVHEYIEVTLTHDYSGAKASYNYAFEDGRAAFDASVSASVTAVKDEKSESVSITFKVEATKEEGFLYIGQASSSFPLITGVKVVSQKDVVVDPVLSVDPEEVTLALTAAKPADSVAVTFKGKNLDAGEYALTVPDLAGLSVKPAAVTVGEDGKLNQEVVIYYTSDVDVAEASTNISLKIGDLEPKVKVNYSASLEKKYAKSVNIEQWVLDNGKDNAAFKAVLEGANIDYENINELDSLNDEKTARNEPYLGLKLKKNGAFVALWLKEGSTVRVKFGNVGDKVIGSINGETDEFTADDLATPLEFTAPVDCYMKLTTTSDKTVVIKQVMIDEPIAEVQLPDSPTALDNTNANAKAVKYVRNGMMLIEKNGEVYNVLGTRVR